MHLTKWQSHEYNYYIKLFISFRNFEPKNFLEADRPFTYYLTYPTTIFTTYTFFVLDII